MSRKLILGLMLMLVGALTIACNPQIETVDEPVEVVETDNEVEEPAVVVETVEEVEVAEEAEEAEMVEEVEETEMAEEAVYTISAGDSNVSWLGSKPVGNSHTGVVDLSEGSLTLSGGELVAGSFVLDMTSIASTDGAPGRLVEHLNSDDFFGTATFPTASLDIISAENVGNDNYAVVGDLTIKGITNPIEFTANATESDGIVNATADIVFDRSLYDVQFGSGSFFSDLGDDLISDEIEIAVELVALSGDAAMMEEAAMVEEAEETEMAEEAVYTVSLSESNVAWVGSKPVGNSHTGVVDLAEGSLTLSGGDLVAGSFVLDMTSIASTDGAPGRLVEHLNSDDFFGTATFPTASLVIVSAESLGDGNYAVVGDLTIKGITNPIEFTASASESDGIVNATADIVFDRSLYDVQFGSGSFFSDLGDDLISDEIEIAVELVALSGDAAMMEEAAMAEDTEMAEEAVYTVSLSESNVAWVGSKPVGNSHTGVVDLAEGSLTLSGGELVAGSFVLDMTSIASTDGAPGRLVEHLNSDDFFGTATFPTASLVIVSAENVGNDNYAVVGDLTIKGITNRIEFTASASESDGVVNGTADIVFDRSLYDVQFGSGTFFSDLGDDLISDEIEIAVELVAQK